jgi:hypothetical protein
MFLAFAYIIYIPFSGGPDSPYGLNDNTKQLIRCPRSMFVNLDFDLFDISYETGQCRDYIAILDGDRPTAPALYNGLKCGSIAQNDLWSGTSFGNTAMVTFVSNDVLSAVGYKLR